MYLWGEGCANRGRGISNLLRNFISFYHQAYRTAVWLSRQIPGVCAMLDEGGLWHHLCRMTSGETSVTR
jgi:hypothetical protein